MGILVLERVPLFPSKKIFFLNCKIFIMLTLCPAPWSSWAPSGKQKVILAWLRRFELQRTLCYNIIRILCPRWTMILNLFYFFMVQLSQKALILHIWIVFVVLKECRHALSPPSKNYGFLSTCQSKVNEKKLSHLREEKKIHKKCKGPQTKWCCRSDWNPVFGGNMLSLKVWLICDIIITIILFELMARPSVKAY